MLQSPLKQFDLQRLAPHHSFKSSNLGFILLEQVSRLDIVVERSGFEFAYPDPDQLAGDIVSLGQRVQGLTSNEFLGNLPLERDAVGTMLGHDFHSPEAQ